MTSADATAGRPTPPPDAVAPGSITHRRLGATVLDGGTRFEVWAPQASSVEVVVSVEHGDDRVAALEPPPSELDPTRPEATWTATVDGVGAGDRYRFRLDGGELLADPASMRQPDGVHGPSMVVDTATFPWSDDGWRGIELDDTILYEVHVGTFTAEGTFDAAIGELERLVDLGVTTIEVMPVAAFPGARNWGYDGVFPFATQETYGGPAAFARFVDAAHAHGLAVVLDVVYNHLGPEGNVLVRFGPYLTDEYATPWGEAVNVAGRHSDSVRRYLVENGVGWIRDFHLDGFRMDAVHQIIDPTANPFVAEFAAAVHDVADELGRTALVIVESSANEPRMVRPRSLHGWGCDAVWNDDVHHALRVALTGERHEYYAGYTGAGDVAEAFEHRFVYHGQHSALFGRRQGADAGDIDHRRLVAFSQNHDHVGNTPRGLRMLHDAGPGDPRLRLAAATVLLGPFTPLLFMGEEYAERAPFPYFVDHRDPDLVRAVQDGRRREFATADWEGGIADPGDPTTFSDAVIDPSQADAGPQRDLLETYRELIRLRRRHRVLTDPSARHVVRLAGDVVVVERELDGARSTLVLNYGAEPDPTDRTSAGAVVFDSSPSASGPLGAHSARLHLA
ncbi:malto-oligosyltrehalose trehalohydrolase [Ilumatobacter sp.]|uniref:malto-oligosyltrehalose trehalohydrolase n=1 Tax=Ilumatobacter sp. TaxID=1967498 RepID=UPI003B527428